MRFVACHTCKSVVQIGGEPEEVKHLLRDQESFPCVKPLCNGRMVAQPPSSIHAGYSVDEMPIRGFYRAINGFGSGKGDPASYRELRELLLTKRVVDLQAKPVGQPERVILRELVLEDGTRLHFETSTKGACIYYIERPGPSCVEVVENELAADATAEGDDTDREETGRAVEALRGLEARARAIANSTPAFEQSDSRSVPAMPKAGDVPADSSTDRRETNTGSDPRMRV